MRSHTYIVTNINNINMDTSNVAILAEEEVLAALRQQIDKLFIRRDNAASRHSLKEATFRAVSETVSLEWPIVFYVDGTRNMDEWYRGQIHEYIATSRCRTSLHVIKIPHLFQTKKLTETVPNYVYEELGVSIVSVWT